MYLSLSLWSSSPFQASSGLQSEISGLRSIYSITQPFGDSRCKPIKYLFCLVFCPLQAYHDKAELFPQRYRPSENRYTKIWQYFNFRQYHDFPYNTKSSVLTKFEVTKVSAVKIAMTTADRHGGYVCSKMVQLLSLVLNFNAVSAWDNIVERALKLSAVMR